jgi:hypothetical protein
VSGTGGPRGSGPSRTLHLRRPTGAALLCRQPLVSHSCAPSPGRAARDQAPFVSGPLRKHEQYEWFTCFCVLPHCVKGQPHTPLASAQVYAPGTCPSAETSIDAHGDDAVPPLAAWCDAAVSNAGARTCLSSHLHHLHGTQPPHAGTQHIQPPVQLQRCNPHRCGQQTPPEDPGLPQDHDPSTSLLVIERVGERRNRRERVNSRY